MMALVLDQVDLVAEGFYSLHIYHYYQVCRLYVHWDQCMLKDYFRHMQIYPTPADCLPAE